MRGVRARGLSPHLLGLLVAALAAGGPPSPSAGPGDAGASGGLRRAPVDASSVATLEDSNQIYLEASAAAGESYVSLAMKYAGSELQWAAIEQANGARPVKPGLFYAIPFAVLTGEYRARAIAALFPSDGPGEEGWVHRVPPGDDGQTFETIALWFAGDTGLGDDLAESNGLDWSPLVAGAEVVIPQAILLPEFVRPAALESPVVSPVPAPAAPAPGRAPQPSPPAPSAPRKPSGPVKVGDLTFVEDESGGYAIYRLKPKEALYSSVVVRFTGRLDPEEVSEVARKIADASGIANMTSIPAGHRIRIPRDLILPEFLPPGDAARASYEAGLAAARRHRITAQARGLEGVTIILDSGHGGDDIGARHNGVQEDDYVYDILCRIKSLAQTTTGARVMATIKDRSSGYRPQDGPFDLDRDEEILTTPPYMPRQPHVSTVGVNLRWYLVNSYYRSLLAGGANPEKVVFVSIHADALHPSLRGSMVYVPGQDYRGRTYGCVGSLYQRREVEQCRYVRFSSREREVSEGLSRRLAVRVLEAFHASGLPVHPYEPIRDHVIRMRRDWTPAVIRSSQVPQSLLLEVVNLNNKSDAALMKDPVFRQRVAGAFLDALKSYYGGAPRGEPSLREGAR